MPKVPIDGGFSFPVESVGKSVFIFGSLVVLSERRILCCLIAWKASVNTS